MKTREKMAEIRQQIMHEVLSEWGRRGAETTNRRLTAEQRRRNATKAIRVRWAQHRRKTTSSQARD